MDPTETLKLAMWQLKRLYEGKGEPEEQVIDRREVVMNLRDLAVHLENGGSLPYVVQYNDKFKVGVW